VTAPVPDLIEPVVGFRKWRLVRDRLSSPFIPLRWEEAEVQAECFPANRALLFGKGWLQEPHRAPHPDCKCGIYAYHYPPSRGPIPYLDRITGVVALWGKIEVHRDGMRAEHARIGALAYLHDLGRDHEQRVRYIATGLGVDVVEQSELALAAQEYGKRLPAEMIP
jgi:hypothetical protein